MLVSLSSAGKCQESIKIVWIAEFREQLSRPDTLSSVGDGLLAFQLEDICKDLCSQKNIKLEKRGSVYVSQSLADEARLFFLKGMSLSKLENERVDFFIITEYMKTEEEYLITSKIERPSVNSKGEITGLQTDSTFTHRYRYSRGADGRVKIVPDAMLPLAEKLAAALYEHYNVPYRSRAWSVYAQPIAGVPQFIKAEDRDRFSRDFPTSILTKLVERKPYILQKSSGETPGGLSLIVKFARDFLNDSVYEITADLTANKDRRILATAESSFRINEAVTFQQAIDAIVDKLVSQLD